MRTGELWEDRINENITGSDYFLAFLSDAAVGSRNVRAELRRASRERERHGRPVIVPIWISFEGELPLSLSAILDETNALSWSSDAETASLLERICHDLDSGATSSTALVLIPLQDFVA